MAETAKQDPFADANDAFVKVEHLKGRLVLVTPLEIGQRASTMRGQEGKMYDYVETETVVLDGETTDLFPTIPFVIDGFQWSGAAVVPQLKPKIASGRPVLGRAGGKPSATKGFGDANILTAPTDEDKAVAREYIASKAKSADPFD
jgi:hypothetical protein